MYRAMNGPVVKLEHLSWVILGLFVATNVHVVVSLRPIETLDGTANGSVCHFPFKYLGLSWSSCVDFDRGRIGRPWCGTTADVDADDLWGFCKLQVRVYDAPPGYTHCHFPFKMGNREFYGCYINTTNPKYSGIWAMHQLPLCGVVPDITNNPNMIGYCMEENKVYGHGVTITRFDMNPFLDAGTHGRCQSPQVHISESGLITEITWREWDRMQHYGCFQSLDPNIIPSCYNSQFYAEKGTCDDIALMGRAFSIGHYDKFGPTLAIDSYASARLKIENYFVSILTTNPWWAVELQHLYCVKRVELYNVHQHPSYDLNGRGQKKFRILVGPFMSHHPFDDSAFEICGQRGDIELDLGYPKDLSDNDAIRNTSWHCTPRLIGQFVALWGYDNTYAFQFKLTEIAVFGEFIGEIIGMPNPKRANSLILQPSTPQSTRTLLFPGLLLAAIDDGILTGWSYYAESAGTFDLQLWRPTDTPNQYTLEYSRTVSPTVSGFHFEGESNTFELLRNDVMGLSFVGPCITPLKESTCSYLDGYNKTYKQPLALMRSSYITEIGTAETFSPTANCLDYMIQASVRYHACQSSPCLNGGTCVEIPGSTPKNAFLCQCLPSYSGTFCQKNENSCLGVVCKNGKCRNSAAHLWYCECDAGYDGRLCGIEADECLSNPCQPGGQCTDAFNKYTCGCFAGYTGTNCETNIDECSSLPCGNNGNCTDEVNSYSCQCDAGYNGTHCAIDIDECQSSPCQHGGSCVDGVNEYICHCAAGYSGVHCETDVDECTSEPCLYGATCLDKVDGYSCQCLAGYSGTQCETDVDECSSNPCLNNGTCYDMVNGYTCECSPGYHSGNCSVYDECFPGPCQNGATCVNGTAAYECLCTPHYTGINCESEVDECLSLPCQHDGNCTDLLGGYTCECVAGYNGTHCETDINDCANSPCGLYGTCVDMVNEFSCICDNGYTGTVCQTDMDECAAVLCENNGTCEDLVGSYSCRCESGYTGLLCETEVDECSSSPCHAGNCTDELSGYSCQCYPGYTGLVCETDVDECGSSPCQNGGTCIDSPNLYVCVCESGYGGEVCQHDLDECLSDPCQNNATCVDLPGSYTCTCPSGFYGTTCYHINDCYSSPCFNDGACIDEPYGFTCVCQPGYTEYTCTNEINECLSQPCQHGGRCMDLVDGYRCRCERWNLGVHCETVVPRRYTWPGRYRYTFEGTLPDERLSARVIGVNMWILVILEIVIWICMDCHTCYEERVWQRLPRRPFIRRVKETVKKCKSKNHGKVHKPPEDPTGFQEQRF